MRFILSLLMEGVLILLCAYLLAGVTVESYGNAILVALILAFANYFIKPILTLLTLPITIITLGLFLLVINGAMVLLTDALIPGFDVDGLLWAILFSIILAFFNYLFGVFFTEPTKE